MSTYVACRTLDKSIIRSGRTSRELAGDFLEKMRTSLASPRHGDVPVDQVAMYVVDNSDLEAGRIMSGDAFVVVWSADAIVGLDFTPEDTKPLLRGSASAPTFLADGVDTVSVSLAIWKSDGSEIDDTVNATKDVRVDTPAGAKTVRVTMTDGIAVKVLRSTVPGVWRFPSPSQRFSNIRIDQCATTEGVVPFLQL